MIFLQPGSLTAEVPLGDWAIEHPLFAVAAAALLAAALASALLLAWRTGTSPYLLLSIVLLLVVAGTAYNDRWFDDFWEHAAVVRELAHHPAHPAHPLLPLTAPHAFASPYTLAVGLVARLTGLSPVRALAVSGIVNTVLLLAACYWFAAQCRCPPFHAMLSTVLLWGFSPWLFSGFLHLRVLGRVAPYPSTTAFALVLLALGCCARFFATGQRRWLAAMVPAGAAALLIHPISGAAWFLGVAAFAVGARPFQLSRLAWAAAACALALALTRPWPLYPFWELVGGAGAFHASNRPLYPGTAAFLERAFPALAGLPFLLARRRQNPRDPLMLWCAALFVLYAAAGCAGLWSWGRVLPFALLPLQMAFGAWLAQSSGRARAAALALLALCALNLSPGVAAALPFLRNNYADYAALAPAIGPDDIVLADPAAALVLPAFTGKVVAYPRPLAFVPDAAARRLDAALFFDPATPDAGRQRIARRYGARFLLFDRRRTRGFPPGLPAAESGSLVLRRLP